MRKLILYPLLIIIASCSGVPKTVNNEQLIMSNEQLAMSNEQAPAELAADEISQPEPVPEEPAVAAADADAEEKPAVEYIETLSDLDETALHEIAGEPELQPADQPSVIVMETLRPAESAALSELSSPVEPASPVELVSSAEPASPSEPAPKPPLALPEQRTAQIVPPVRESRRPSTLSESPVPPFKKDETPEIAQEPPPNADNQPEPALAEERVLQPDYPITFSRIARVTVGQLVEIPFYGKDWVFLGEVGARRGIAYDSRKMDSEGESFIFRVDAAGVYALKFYRQDFAHDLILNDHVQIIAGAAPQTTGLVWFNPPVDRSRVIAGPRWPNFLEQPPVTALPPQVVQPPVVVQPPAEVVQPAQPPAVAKPPAVVRPPVETAKPATPPVTSQPSVTAQPPVRQPSAAKNETPLPQGLSGNAVAQASPVQPQSEPPPPVAEPVSPDVLLKQAREEFNAGRIASALTLLDQFRKSFPSGSDEAWWLYGQCYEANSPNRNILAALEHYRRLVREYPQSSRLSDARRRISYLERYYINIQ
ncbi:MAG: tetratricopeptide repeat protein [Treponema sp.]|jgi:hypothetical protein|nr:tetratricopeptide repeat protein [Treponema sp.]